MEPLDFGVKIRIIHSKLLEASASGRKMHTCEIYSIPVVHLMRVGIWAFEESSSKNLCGRGQ